MVFAVSGRFPQPSSELNRVSVIVGSEERLAVLVDLYEDYISQEWYQPWDSLIWVAGELSVFLHEQYYIIASVLCN